MVHNLASVSLVKQSAAHRRSRRAASLLGAAAALGLGAPAALAQLTVDNGGGTPDIWLIADNWVGNALPTAADDVVFDNSAATLGAVFSLNDTNAAGDVSANSITFGSSANATALAAFTLQANTTNSTANVTRSISLASGAITAHSSVTGTQTIASSPTTGIITLTAGDGSYEFANNSTAGELAVQAVISGVGASVTSNAGVVRISGANTYTGATAVTAGELIIADAGTFNNTASITISSGAKLTVAANAANLSKIASVPVGATLRYAASQSGTTAADAPGMIYGTVELGFSPSPGYALDMGNDAVLVSDLNRTWANSINIHGDRAIILSNNGNMNVSTGTISAATAGAKTLELTGTFTSATPSLISATIADGAGTVSLLKTGTGMFRLSGTNSFTGGVTIKEGNIRIENPAAWGLVSVPITLGDTTGSAEARIVFANNGGMTANDINVVAGSTGLAGFETRQTTGAVGVSGTITLAKDLTIFTVSGVGGINLTGPVVLNSHDLNFDLGVSVGSPLSTSSAMRLSGPLTGSGGTITLGGSNNGGVVSFDGDNSGLSHNIIVNTGRLRVYNSATGLGTGEVHLADGREILANRNGLTPAFTYYMGKLVVLPGGTGSVSVYNTGARHISFDGPVELGSAGNGGATLNLGTNDSSSHSVHMRGVTMFGDSAIRNDYSNLARLFNISGGVHDDGNNRSLTKSGIGTVVLGATYNSSGSLVGQAGAVSTYGGNTTVEAGRLRLGIDNALPAGTTVDVATGAELDLSASGTVITNINVNLEVAGLTGGGTVTGSTINTAGVGSRTLTVSGAGTYAFSGVIQNKPLANATANNVLSLLKKGIGTQTLSGSNTYTGLTTVEDGTLAVAGSHDSNHGGYSVTGGTLQVSGAISATGTPAAVSATGAGVVSITGTGSLRASTVSSVAGLVNDGTLLPVTSATLAGLSGTGTTTLDGAATLSATHIRQGTLNVNDAAVASVNTNGGDTGTSRIGSLNIAAGAKLDVKDNDLVVTGMSAAAVRSLLVTGFNSGDWAGNGLTSSAAQNDPTFYTALGYADNAELGYATFSGQSVSGTDILVKYTFYGDTDLNGVVDSDDLTNWIDGFNGVGSQVWLYGDFDYSGVVDSDDLTLWVDGFLNTVGPLSASLQAEFSAALASGLASGDFSALQAVASSIVPEPASLSLLALGALALRRRRR